MPPIHILNGSLKQAYDHWQSPDALNRSTLSIPLSLEPADYGPDDIIRRDVVVLGGGSSGTYSAIRLQDFGKSVIIVEKGTSLGRHTETYIDPATGIPLEIGVLVFAHLPVVKDYFSRFNIPLTPLPTSYSTQTHFHHLTGCILDGPPVDKGGLNEAFIRYAQDLAKYPEVQRGFDLVYPVAEDLLLPFGEFVEKHKLQPLLYLIFSICHGYSPLRDVTTLYIMKYFNAGLLESLGKGFLTTKERDSSELYKRAQEHLGSENLSLGSTVTRMDRNSSNPSMAVRLVIQTPQGPKLILAKKLISTIPPTMSNLQPYDLSEDERHCFQQFSWNAYYSCVVKNHGLPSEKLPFHPTEPSDPQRLPTMPGLYAINPAPPPSKLVQAYYGSPHEI